MTDLGKITGSHLRRGAVVYLRQSSLAQVERNRESTARQYNLVERAVGLGWPHPRVTVIDADLGVSGASTAGRSGFAELTAQVGLGEVGIVLALEVSRLARNNADWYRLLDLAGMTDTLIADADGVYHPALFNDRMLLGLKGTMSEAELHILRARLNGGIRNKAARGELRRPLPIGLVWAAGPGEVHRHPNEAVTGVLAAIFRRFGEVGSVRKVWLWLREENLTLPLQRHGYVAGSDEVEWVEPTYHAVHTILTHPAYAGAYVYGRTRTQRYVDDTGTVRIRHTALPRDQWEILIRDHHEGFIDWDTYEANQARIGANIRPQAHQPGTGAVREGCALLQSLATCGTCGRKLTVFYQGPTTATPGYYCQGPATIVDGRGTRHLHIGGVALDTAVADAFLTALAPSALTACLTAAEQLEHTHDAVLDQHRRQVERARYQASRAERRYQAVDPDNRLVARGLEAAWEKTLTELAAAEADLARREQARPRALTDTERAGIRALGDNLRQVWDAPTTTDRDRKQLLRTLIDEVKVTVVRDDDAGHTDLLIRWKGGALTELTVPGRRRPPAIRTDEDTVDLIRRLAVHYPDATIAGILNRQGRRTARGLTFTATRVQSLRFHWGIPCHQPDPDQPRGDLLTIADAAKQLGIAPSTLHRWLGDGFVAGEQDTPGAPWRIRMTDQLRNLFVDDAPDGWLAMLEATLALGVSRQTVLQRVKRGELKAVHVRTGRRKGLRIQVPPPTDALF
ncbi:recombinase family protein [Frankia sp. CiP3]|uniref:recombinase family protein n=1 Tax=Frankia sp. CiP3 TaxID=2880971 RepID=UPI001EF5FC5A|nr:recombinase family protein [Frankia sp. CiP3]